MKTISLQKCCVYTLLALTILFTGCPDSNPTAPSKTVEELLSSPEEVNINGQNYTLSSYLWRDFMPPSDGSDLMAVVTISEKNSIEIPAGLDATYLWVINGDEVWSTSFSDESRPPTPTYQLGKIARGGPKWDTGINVDVVVKIIDGSGGEYLLKVSTPLIQATY